MEKPLFIVLWLVSVFAVIFSYSSYHVFNSRDYNTSSHSFTKTEDVYEQFYVEMIFPTWTNTSWDFAYIWQIAWIVYALTLMLRQGKNGKLYYSPPFFSHWIFLPYIFAALFNIIWNVLFSMRCLDVALFFILLVPVLLAVSIAISLYCVRQYGQQLVDEQMKKELVFVLLFLQYGLGFYFVWTLITALTNFAMVLTYYNGVAMETATTAMLVIFGVLFTVWFILDNFVLEKACRYFAIAYYSSIYALIAITVRNYRSGSRNSIISIVLILLITIYFVVKIVYSSLRSKKHPLYKPVDNKVDLPSDNVKDDTV